MVSLLLRNSSCAMGLIGTHNCCTTTPRSSLLASCLTGASQRHLKSLLCWTMSFVIDALFVAGCLLPGPWPALVPWSVTGKSGMEALSPLQV